MTTFAKHKYHTLDGIRGVAALLVAKRHIPYYFGSAVFPASYPAADLFFVLSGFVLAEAYEKRLADGMTAGTFMRLRLVRIYPLYLLGVILGFVAAVAAMMVGTHYDLTVSKVAASFGFAIFLLPSPAYSTLYPLDPPAWALMCILIVNGLYAHFHATLTKRKLIGVIAVLGVVLMLCAYHYGGLGGGFTWDTAHVGLVRVLYSFSVGLLIQRLPRPQLKLRLPSWVWIVVAVLLMRPVLPVYAHVWYGIFLVLLLYPLVVLAASTTEPRSKSGVAIYSFLGMTSYAVYILHDGIALLIGAGLRRVAGIDVRDFSPYSGIVLLIFLVVLAGVLDRIYDQPARRFLARKLE